MDLKFLTDTKLTHSIKRLTLEIHHSWNVSVNFVKKTADEHTSYRICRNDTESFNDEICCE